MAAPVGQSYAMGQGQYPPNYPPQQPGYYQQPPPGQYPPQPYYQPGYGAPGTHLTVVQQPVVLPQPIMLKQLPVSMRCPHCGATIVTQLDHRVGNTTFLYCLMLSCFGCCCIPFCTDCAKDVAHQCPSCRKELGVFRRPLIESGGGSGASGTGYDRSFAHGPADDYVGPSDD
ncbi:hypothetical protein OS493_001155 [Desmophyllum pertusum]|uniref:LITAF domain-containing protein n=1 Tax=Desmophyllum pertusum TaxID=174260 RepID=A0A9X0D5P1_9CNID|nr:hypothetical protein OS493_001155 [Desmophyllum pertusum]